MSSAVHPLAGNLKQEMQIRIQENYATAYSYTSCPADNYSSSYTSCPANDFGSTAYSHTSCLADNFSSTAHSYTSCPVDNLSSTAYSYTSCPADDFSSTAYSYTSRPADDYSSFSIQLHQLSSRRLQLHSISYTSRPADDYSSTTPAVQQTTADQQHTATPAVQQTTTAPENQKKKQKTKQQQTTGLRRGVGPSHKTPTSKVAGTECLPAEKTPSIGLKPMRLVSVIHTNSKNSPFNFLA